MGCIDIKNKENKENLRIACPRHIVVFFFPLNDVLFRYHEAGDKAKARVLELLRQLSMELQVKVNILVFASMLLVIAKALFAHVRLEVLFILKSSILCSINLGSSLHFRPSTTSKFTIF